MRRPREFGVPRHRAGAQGGHRSSRRGRIAAATATLGAPPDELQGTTRLFNTATRVKDQFVPNDAPRVSFYSCGPTVYDFAHVGNFRAFLTYDVLKRWLTYCGYDVDHVCNLTDVDDKIITRAQRDGRSIGDVSDEFAREFFVDLELLNCVPARAYPRATEHIGEIVTMVEALLAKGVAYERGGSHYFAVDRFEGYGRRLAKLDFDGMQDGAGEGIGDNALAAPDGETAAASATDDDEYDADEKASAKDFALWKAYKPSDGDVAWETPLGRGRPGWHIECSAMARKFLGDSIDLHAGGIDLVFPHHENEVAQSEACTGKPFAKYWVHNGFVNVNNEKMSKSKGNFRTLRTAVDSALDVRAFRYLVVSSQYRAGLNFSPETLAAARSTLKRLDRFRDGLQQQLAAEAEEEEEEGDAAAPSSELRELARRCVRDFEVGMADDLNSPRALASLFKLVKRGQAALTAGDASRSDARDMLGALDAIDAVLGVFYAPAFDAAVGKGEGGEGEGEGDEVPETVLALVRVRADARAAKDWSAADAARDELAALGFKVKDNKGGEPSLLRV